jgi:hypothetical protein
MLHKRANSRGLPKAEVTDERGTYGIDFLQGCERLRRELIAWENLNADIGES